jgi:hypothetical protein
MKIKDIVEDAQPIKGVITATDTNTVKVQGADGNTVVVPATNQFQPDPNTPNGVVTTANPVEPKPGDPITMLPTSDSTAIAEKDHSQPIGGDPTDDYIDSIQIHSDDEETIDDEEPTDDLPSDDGDTTNHEIEDLKRILQMLHV